MVWDCKTRRPKRKEQLSNFELLNPAEHWEAGQVVNGLAYPGFKIVPNPPPFRYENKPGIIDVWGTNDEGKG